MQESTFLPNLKQVESEMGKVVFQHEVDIPYVAPTTLYVAILVASPSTTIVVTSEDEDQKCLMSTLSKLFEKNKLVKSFEKTLIEVLEKMQKIVTTTIAIPNLQLKAMELVKTFDKEFITLAKVAPV